MRVAVRNRETDRHSETNCRTIESKTTPLKGQWIISMKILLVMIRLACLKVLSAVLCENIFEPTSDATYVVHTLSRPPDPQQLHDVSLVPLRVSAKLGLSPANILDKFIYPRTIKPRVRVSANVATSHKLLKKLHYLRAKKFAKVKGSQAVKLFEVAVVLHNERNFAASSDERRLADEQQVRQQQVDTSNISLDT